LSQDGGDAEAEGNSSDEEQGEICGDGHENLLFRWDSGQITRRVKAVVDQCLISDPRRETDREVSVAQEARDL